VYFTIAKFPPLSGGIISAVTSHSTGLANILGGDYTAGSLVYQGGEMLYTSGFSAGAGVIAPILRTDGSSVVYIEFACTGVQSIMIFVGPILFSSCPDIKKKLKMGLLFAFLIYFLNLFRNAGIITLIDKFDYSPAFAHDIVGKAGSLAALLILAFLIFRLVPELLDDVDKLLDLFANPTRQKRRSRPEEPDLPEGENQQE